MQTIIGMTRIFSGPEFDQGIGIGRIAGPRGRGHMFHLRSSRALIQLFAIIYLKCDGQVKVDHHLRGLVGTSPNGAW